jgi:hypothetical protein
MPIDNDKIEDFSRYNTWWMKILEFIRSWYLSGTSFTKWVSSKESTFDPILLLWIINNMINNLISMGCYLGKDKEIKRGQKYK